MYEAHELLSLHGHTMQLFSMHATAKVPTVLAVWLLLILCCRCLLVNAKDMQHGAKEGGADLKVAATKEASVRDRCIGKYAVGCARCRNGESKGNASVCLLGLLLELRQRILGMV